MATRTITITIHHASGMPWDRFALAFGDDLIVTTDAAGVATVDLVVGQRYEIGPAMAVLVNGTLHAYIQPVWATVTVPEGDGALTLHELLEIAEPVKRGGTQAGTTLAGLRERMS